ncbi:MAG: signal peptidase I [Clostridiales bacterium]|nr:signal peptidase I [Clostridiales bacterium]
MNKNVKCIMASELFALIKPLLEEGREACFIVSGMSMWPFIHHNRDSVIVKSIDFNHLKVGDIILFEVPCYEKYMLHRIMAIDKKKKRFQTAGDGNYFIDGWFPGDSVIAVVTGMKRKGKFISANSLTYRLLASMWRILFPVRKQCVFFLKKISRIKSGIVGLFD